MAEPDRRIKFPAITEMAKEVAEKAMDEYEYEGKTIRQWVDEILRAEQGGWISVSEKLPDKSSQYIVTYKGGRTTDCYYNKAEREWWENIDHEYTVRHGVIAWMPFPEPYKGDKE